MARQAMDKKTFYKSGFDTSEYDDFHKGDKGIHFAKLVLKRWGSTCMFLYFELENEEKRFAFVRKPNKYLGFWDIPDGAIVRLKVGRKYMLTDAEWLLEESDPREARKHYSWIKGVVRQYKRILSRMVASIGFVLPLRRGDKTPKGALPCNPNKNRKD